MPVSCPDKSLKIVEPILISGETASQYAHGAYCYVVLYGGEDDEKVLAIGHYKRNAIDDQDMDDIMKFLRGRHWDQEMVPARAYQELMKISFLNEYLATPWQQKFDDAPSSMKKQIVSFVIGECAKRFAQKMNKTQEIKELFENFSIDCGNVVNFAKLLTKILLAAEEEERKEQLVEAAKYVAKAGVEALKSRATQELEAAAAREAARWFFQRQGTSMVTTLATRGFSIGGNLISYGSILTHGLVGLATTAINRWQRWMNRDERIRKALQVLLIVPVSIERLASNRNAIDKQKRQVTLHVHPDKCGGSVCGTVHIENINCASKELLDEVDYYNKSLLKKVGDWASEAVTNTVSSVTSVFSAVRSYFTGTSSSNGSGTLAKRSNCVVM